MDYSDLNLTPQLNATDSLVNQNTEQLKEYIDQQIDEIIRPGGLNYYSTGEGRGYQAVVSMNPSQGAFTDLQTAVNYVESIGGGRVLLSVGTYVTNANISVTVPGIEIIGEDKETCVLKVADGANLGTLFDINTSNVVLSSFTIDGNKANQSSGNQNLIDFVDTTSKNLNVNNVNFINQYGAGGACLVGAMDNSSFEHCFFGTCDGKAFVGTQADGNRVLFCRGKSLGRGIFLGSNSTAIDCLIETTSLGEGFAGNFEGAKFTNCYGSGCTGYGFSANAAGVLILGCNADNCIDGGILIKANVQSNTVIGCKVSSNDNNSISVGSGASDFALIGNDIGISGVDATNGISISSSSGGIISGNNIHLLIGGSVTDNTYSGILFSGTSTRNIVTSNQITASQGTFNLAYGVRESSGSDDYNVYVGNIIRGAGTQMGTQGANGTAGFNILA